MRSAAIALVLVVAASAQAQVGGTPRNITFTPIDTSKAIGARDLSSAFKASPNVASSPLNLAGMFPKISLPSFPPKTPNVSVMPQAQNQFQPNPIKGGVNLFNYPKKKK